MPFIPNITNFVSRHAHLTGCQQQRTVRVIQRDVALVFFDQILEFSYAVLCGCSPQRAHRGHDRPSCQCAQFHFLGRDKLRRMVVPLKAKHAKYLSLVVTGAGLAFKRGLDIRHAECQLERVAVNEHFFQLGGRQKGLRTDHFSRQAIVLLGDLKGQKTVVGIGLYNHLPGSLRTQLSCEEFGRRREGHYRQGE